MPVMMFRGRIKEDKVAEAEAGVEKLFAAVNNARPEGIRYASTRLDGGTTFVAFLQLDDPANNPVTQLPEFTEFQANLQSWLAEESPAPEQLTVVGSYRLFD